MLQVLLLLTAAAAAHAQGDWRAVLASDLVRAEGSNMVIDDYRLVQLAVDGYEPVNFQVKIHSEAPTHGSISRDQFVAATTTLSSSILIAAFSDSFDVSPTVYIDGFSSRRLASPIGTPDLEISLLMTDEELHMEVVDPATGDRTRTVEAWSSVFAAEGT